MQITTNEATMIRHLEEPSDLTSLISAHLYHEHLMDLSEDPVMYILARLIIKGLVVVDDGYASLTAKGIATLENLR